MAEFKRVFSKAIMNKDMDERLVPNGQYRDANNIEVATSEGSEVGTVQTLFGNTLKNTLDSGSLLEIAYSTQFNNLAGTSLGPHYLSTTVGVIAQQDTDRIYYMVAAGGYSNTNDLITASGSSRNTIQLLDYINMFL